jgi:hypothetical protein
MNLPPLHWDFCLDCGTTLTPEQIADDDSYCAECLEQYI